MIIALAQAYNGLHKTYAREFKKRKVETFYFDIDTPAWQVNLNKKKFDAVLWHADAKDERCREILDRVYFIEKILKKPMFPDTNMYFTYNDKIKQYDLFEFLKAPYINTYISYKKPEALNIAKRLKYPIVIKNTYGYGGKHVFKIESQKEARDAIEQIFDRGYNGIQGYFYAQDFIKTDCDLRIITVANEVVAYWRVNPGNWKHNISRGGQVILDDVPKEAIRICQKISRAMKFHWMSYDLFARNGRYYLLEMACNFSTKGIEARGVNVREKLVQYIVDYLKK